MTERPPRRIPHNLTHHWHGQAIQYERRSDIPVRPGIVAWQAPLSETYGVPVLCLLHYSGNLFQNLLTGILNYFPEGSPFGDEVGDYFIIVKPSHRRQSIGTMLTLEAVRRWQVDLLKQSYSDEGWALAESVLLAF